MNFFNPLRYSLTYTVLLILLEFVSVRAQNNQDILAYVKNAYGTSEVLVNGIEYLDGNLRIDGTPNLFSESWLTANIFIKGEEFSEQKVKYNIHTDQLVLKFITNDGVQRGVVLDNVLVDSFNIQGHMFISSHFFNNKNLDRRFVEYVKIKSGVIYITYYKEHIKFYTDSQPYGKYSETKRVVNLMKDNQYFDVSKKRNLLKLFPISRKEVNRFLRKNGIKYKTATVNNFESLLRINE